MNLYTSGRFEECIRGVLDTVGCSENVGHTFRIYFSDFHKPDDVTVVHSAQILTLGLFISTRVDIYVGFFANQAHTGQLVYG